MNAPASGSAKNLTQATITSAPLRRVIPPARVVDPAAFAEQVNETRNQLVEWLAQADPHTLAAHLLDLARTETDVDYP